MKTKQLIQFWEQKKQENAPKDWEVDKAPSNQDQVQDNLEQVGPEDLEDTPTLDELVTLYHVTNAPWWATEIQKAKEKGTGFDDLDHPIDPALSLNKRNKEIFGDGRGGDDLGPGFYVGDTPEFADYYGKNYEESDASVLKFQLPKSKLDALNRKDVAPDDETEFNDFMSKGFYSYDEKSDTQHQAELDQNPTGHDLLTGPINDVEKPSVPRVEEDGRKHVQGNILKFGQDTPLQYNFATDKGARALYDESTIEAISLKDWNAQRKEQK